MSRRLISETHSTVSDPLIVGFGDWIPDRTGVLIWTGEGPLLPKGCLILKSEIKTNYCFRVV